MRILISPTAFKGTLSPWQATRIISRSIRSYWPQATLIERPLADGGDGTLETLIRHAHGSWRSHLVTGPLGKRVRARWGILYNGSSFREPTAVIEMAEASGLKLLHEQNRILEATSIGTGELIAHAIHEGCKIIYLGVGGTACSDGGAGALYALGFRFVDKFGSMLKPTPQALMNIALVLGPHRWDPFSDEPNSGKVIHASHPMSLNKVKLVILCDVNNPLLGAKGSARTFGPQKGATKAEVELLESFLRRWSSLAFRQTRSMPGAGAAGGIAFGLSAFANATLVAGADCIMDFLDWKKDAKTTTLIVTGEGKLDKTSFSGKVIGEIVKHKSNNKVLVVCGSTTLSPVEWKKRGLTNVVALGLKGRRFPEQALKAAIPSLLKSSEAYL